MVARVRTREGFTHRQPCPILKIRSLQFWRPDRYEAYSKGRAFRYGGLTLLDTSALVMKSPEWQEHRRKVGWSVAAKNGSISEFARRVGIQTQTACKWLNNHDHDLYRSLRENAQAHNVLPRDKRLHRLMTYREAREDGLSHTKASKVCGVSQNRMRIWLQLWAPDGVDQAIEDETDDADAVREAA